jgi:hypothetical protein
VTWFETLGVNQNRLGEVTSALLKIYNDANPITVTTPDAIYKEMVMTHAPLPRKVEDGLCYKMQIDFVHVRRVKPKTEDVPEGQTDSEAEGKSGETEKDGGAANQEDIGTGIQTIENTETVEINTSFMDASAGGSIITGSEITAFCAAMIIGRIF